jgi:hypothetical protein
VSLLETEISEDKQGQKQSRDVCGSQIAGVRDSEFKES